VSTTTDENHKKTCMKEIAKQNKGKELLTYLALFKMHQYYSQANMNATRN